MDYVEPPSDPNEWTDEQWLEWLKATDEDPPDEAGEGISKVVQRVVKSTSGQVMGQAMLGMARAIYGRQDDDAIVVVEDAGEGVTDEPFAVRLDPEHPERSSVVFRTGPDSPT